MFKLSILIFSVFILSGFCKEIQQKQTENGVNYRRKFYQIYVRSFKDSDGDGYGDIKGIIEKLDYLKNSLYVDTLVLSSIFESSQIDHGYDVTDYKKIDKIYGTLDDFKELLSKAKENFIEIVLDFVPNHTSDQHEWFEKSVKREGIYTNFYVWHDGIATVNSGRPLPPNNWNSEYHGSAWTWNEDREQYYLHKFSKNQPDLNYRSQAVRNAIEEVLEFWLELGIGGFHIDSAYHLMEDPGFRNETLSGLTDDENDPKFTIKEFSEDNEFTFELLDEWRNVTTKHKKLLLAETSSNLDNFHKYHGHVDIPMNKLFLHYGTVDHRILNYLMNFVENPADVGFYLGSHKNSRIKSRYGPKMSEIAFLASYFLTFNPFYYYGDEIGMVDHDEIDWDNTQDLQACSLNPVDFAAVSRDKQRTPMQWDNTTNAGFTSGQSWIEVHPNYEKINLANQINEEKSTFNLYSSVNNYQNHWLFQDYAQIKKVKPTADIHAVMALTGPETYILLMNLADSKGQVNFNDLELEYNEENFLFIPRPKLRVHYATTESKYRKNDVIETAKILELDPYEAIFLESSASIAKLSFLVLLSISFIIFVNFFI